MQNLYFKHRSLEIAEKLYKYSDKVNWGTAFTSTFLPFLLPSDVFTEKIPVLTVDGKPLPESLAINRYLARMANLIPEDPFEAATVDALCDKLNDFFNSAA